MSNAKSVAALREMIAEKASMAIGVITDLALMSESDKVRLDAAKTILDRVGVGSFQTVEVQTDAMEHVRVAEELDAVRARLATNVAARHGELPPAPEPDLIMVLEDDLEELPVAGFVHGRIIEVGYESDSEEAT